MKILLSKYRGRIGGCWLRTALTVLQAALLAVCMRAVAWSQTTPGESGQAAASTGNDSWWQSALEGPAQPLLGEYKSGPLSGLHISGFYQNTTGLWINPEAIKQNPSKNNLATERNLLQIDINDNINENNKFFARFWGVYEPSYPYDEAAGMNSDYYNQYGFREAWWKYSHGPLTLFAGRQIVTWGESLAFRVGDVVNPQDFSWNFGFANLEQSRMALWMLHPTVTLSDLGPLSDNFAEGIFVPALQPVYYNNTATVAQGGYGPGHDNVAGAVSILPLPGTNLIGSRFWPLPYPYVFPAIAGGHQATFPQLAPPFAPGPLVDWRLPLDTWANSEEGFRLHTIVDNTEITALYWHGHQYVPTLEVQGPPGFQRLIGIFPQLNDVGLTANRPLVVPGAWASDLPLVVRAEGVIQDRSPYNTIDTTVPNAVHYSPTFMSLVALDLDQVYMPWLSETGALMANLEWNNQTIIDYNKNLIYGSYAGALDAERWRKNEEFLLLSLQDSWWWSAVAPQFVMLYNPDGNTIALFPHVTLTPPWTSKYFVNLQYVGVLGNDKYNSYALGMFKGKSMFLIQFQYDFNLI